MKNECDLKSKKVECLKPVYVCLYNIDFMHYKETVQYKHLQMGWELILMCLYGLEQFVIFFLFSSSFYYVLPVISHM